MGPSASLAENHPAAQGHLSVQEWVLEDGYHRPDEQKVLLHLRRQRLGRMRCPGFDVATRNHVAASTLTFSMMFQGVRRAASTVIPGASGQTECG